MSEWILGNSYDSPLGEVRWNRLDHWGLHRPDVVAHDSGGAVALGVHIDRGVPYRRLALVDAVSLAPWEASSSRW